MVLSFKANFRTKKINHKKNRTEYKDFCLRKQENALSKFYSFLTEKVDSETFAKSGISELEPSWLLTRRLKITLTLYQQPIFPEKNSNNAR